MRPGRAERFWAKVDLDGPIPLHRPDLGPCWHWTGAVTGRGGYGAFWDGGRRQAHRVGHEILGLHLPDGLVIDHLCRNPRCVRPLHHEWVTSGENTRRGHEFRRLQRVLAVAA